MFSNKRSILPGGKTPVNLSKCLLKGLGYEEEFEYFDNYSDADADPGSGDFFTPGSGCVKNQDPDPGMKNPDHISDCLETVCWG